MENEKLPNNNSYEFPRRREFRLKSMNNKFFSVQPASPDESKKIIFILFGIIALGLVIVYYSPFEFIFTLLGYDNNNGCPMLIFTGIPCPFCGMGRVFSCITDLYIARSFTYNPLGLLFYILLGAYFSTTLWLAIQKKKIVYTARGKKLIWFPVIFIALMWILNILFGHHHTT